MYSITENIYYSQLYSVAILLQPEPVSHRTIQGKDWVLSSYMLSSCGLPLPPTRLLVAVNEARSYFASTAHNITNSSDILKYLRQEGWIVSRCLSTNLSNLWIYLSEGLPIGISMYMLVCLRIYIYMYLSTVTPSVHSPSWAGTTAAAPAGFISPHSHLNATRNSLRPKHA
jgi:hypothetical protein